VAPLGWWVSVEDGPCYPRADDCDAIAESWQRCLLQLDTGSETDDEEFCGRGPRELTP
jgi:hypothetical protein